MTGSILGSDVGYFNVCIWRKPFRKVQIVLQSCIIQCIILYALWSLLLSAILLLGVLRGVGANDLPCTCQDDVLTTSGDGREPPQSQERCCANKPPDRPVIQAPPDCFQWMRPMRALQRMSHAQTTLRPRAPQTPCIIQSSSAAVSGFGSDRDHQLFRNVTHCFQRFNFCF